MLLRNEREKLMSKLESALQELYKINQLTYRNHWMNHLHPVVKLIITIAYMISVVSSPSYHIVKLIYLMSYLIVLLALNQLSLWRAIKRIKLVFPFLFIMGVCNLFFQRQVIGHIGYIGVTLGMLSMITLVLKGVLCMISSYLLVATTSIDEIGYGLYLLKVPKIIVMQILMTYRYINVLLKEIKQMNEAYALRAPKQKGIRFNVWGMFCGQLLLKTIDRAQQIYESMALRGYQGQYNDIQKRYYSKIDKFYLITSLGFLLILWRLT